MAKEVVWTKIILETFLEESGILDRIELGDEKARILEGIMRTRCAGWKISKQAMEFGCDESTINKYILELKTLYDETQKHSLILPKRIKKSKTEEKLDEIVANRIEDKNAQITAQQNEINALRLRASQEAQNAYLISQLGPKCPEPAYVVNGPTPVNFPTNCCGTFAGFNTCGTY